MEILIIDEGHNEDKVVLGFTNSNGEIEYTIYHRGDGGTIGDPDSDIGAILANEAGITEYQDYILEEIE